MKKIQEGKIAQPILITILIAITVVICFAMWNTSRVEQAKGQDEHAEDAHTEAKEDAHSDDTEKNDHADSEHASEGEIQLTTAQFQAQGLKLDTVARGEVAQVTALPGKLVVNTDQQAHVSPNFSGHVEQVNVALGQTVSKGQTLAVLSVPELIDQQGSLRLAQAQLDLARQDYQREQQLWSQGISAKQDYLRAENTYRQAQISVQSAQARLKALGAGQGNNGRFTLRAPISGVISQKDIVVGENVQLADQLFVIEKMQDLWLEFNVPSQYVGKIQPQQQVQLTVNGSTQAYEAVVHSLTSQADAQTGTLVVRAKLTQHAEHLRPNVMVNVLLPTATQKNALRIQKSAVQSIDGKTTVFVLEAQEKDQIHLKAQTVTLGQSSSDGAWQEVQSGLQVGQRYISQGSFLLKSELEKDEAGHEH